jgi:hypothetical protein
MREITYPEFAFDSDLTQAVIELERAHAGLNRGTTPSKFYFQLKDLFQLLTSIMAARIEGNRTSILNAVVGDSNRRACSGSRPFEEGVPTPGSYRAWLPTRCWSNKASLPHRTTVP